MIGKVQLHNTLAIPIGKFSHAISFTNFLYDIRCLRKLGYKYINIFYFFHILNYDLKYEGN